MTPVPEAWEGAPGGFCKCGIRKHECAAGMYCCANIGGCLDQEHFGECLPEPVKVETEEEEEDSDLDNESEEEEGEDIKLPNSTVTNGTGLIGPLNGTGVSKVCLNNTNLACVVDAECGAEGPCVDAIGLGKVCSLNTNLTCVVDAE